MNIEWEICSSTNDTHSPQIEDVLDGVSSCDEDID